MIEMAKSEVLTLPRAGFSCLPTQGAWRWSTKTCGASPVWLPREQAEQDERYLQLIPYLLLLNPRDEIWCYARRGGDDRLLDRLSCGVGGHVERPDQGPDLAATLASALRREVTEELGETVAERFSGLPPRAWIYEHLSAIGRVHVGVLYSGRWRDKEPPQPREPGIESLDFRPVSEILADTRFELWSRLAAEWIGHG